MNEQHIVFNTSNDKHTLVVTTDADGKKRVVFKHLCAIFGLSYGNQVIKLKSRGKFNCSDISTVAEDGKSRLMLQLDLEDVEGWVNDINVSKVKEERREALRTFQRNCTAILHGYYNQTNDALLVAMT